MLQQSQFFPSSRCPSPITPTWPWGRTNSGRPWPWACGSSGTEAARWPCCSGTPIRGTDGRSASLEVLAGDARNAAGFLAEFRRRMRHRSVLKGQVISLVMGEYGPSTAGVTFHARPALAASDVILPDGLLQKVADHALGIAAHRASLRDYGQHLKRGILLYGKPGTGKTHTVRYLLSQSEGSRRSCSPADHSPGSPRPPAWPARSSRPSWCWRTAT